MATQSPGFAWTGDVHGLLATYVLLPLVGLHVAAALYHWLVRRDDVLQRMLPGQRPHSKRSSPVRGSISPVS